MTSQPPRAPCAPDQACRVSVTRYFPRRRTDAGVWGTRPVGGWEGTATVPGGCQGQCRATDGELGLGEQGEFCGISPQYNVSRHKGRLRQGTCLYDKSCLGWSSQSDSGKALVSWYCWCFVYRWTRKQWQWQNPLLCLLQCPTGGLWPSTRSRNRNHIIWDRQPVDNYIRFEVVTNCDRHLGSALWLLDLRTLCLSGPFVLACRRLSLSDLARLTLNCCCYNELYFCNFYVRLSLHISLRLTLWLTVRSVCTGMSSSCPDCVKRVSLVQIWNVRLQHCFGMLDHHHSGMSGYRFSLTLEWQIITWYMTFNLQWLRLSPCCGLSNFNFAVHRLLDYHFPAACQMCSMNCCADDHFCSGQSDDHFPVDCQTITLQWTSCHLITL